MNRGGYTEVWYPNVTCVRCTLPRVRWIAPVAGETIALEYRTEPLGARIGVRVTDAQSGAAVAGVPIRMVADNGRTVRGTTNANGQLVTTPNLRAGNYYLHAEPSAHHLAAMWDRASGRTCDFCPDRDATPIALEGTDVRRIELRVERGAVIRGRVVDAATGLPLSASLHVQGKAVSTVAGQFELIGLYPGEHRIETVSRNYDRAVAGVTVARDAVVDVEIALHATCPSVIEPADVSLPAEGGGGSFEVQGRCSWNVLATTPGIRAEREGNAVRYRVAPNPFPLPRTLRVFIEGAAFTVQQSADGSYSSGANLRGLASRSSSYTPAKTDSRFGFDQ